MQALQTLLRRLPEPAKDARLNLPAVLQQTVLTPAQKWGTAAAVAHTLRDPELLAAVLADAGSEVEPAVLRDALAAASLMAMNNVYYRFRHLVGKPAYAQKPPRLRMQRLANPEAGANPAAGKVDFELFALAVSAVNACESCIQAHEHAVREGGLSEDHVHDAVRIAAVLQAVAVGRSIAPLEAVSSSPERKDP